MIKIIFEHRSIRSYKNTAIKDEILTEILEAGIRASNTGNMQVYSMIVTKDESLRKQLCAAHFGQKMVEQAPVHITFCVDTNRFHKWCELRNAEIAYNNFLWFVNASVDAVLASQNVALAAETHGLGICYLGTATYNADKIIDILQLPKGVVPVAAIVVGYPADTPALTPRLGFNAVVHYETYNNFQTDDIEAIYADLEASENSKKFVAENNVDNLAQVFTKIRYKKADNEFFSKKYLDVIRKQGFEI